MTFAPNPANEALNRIRAAFPDAALRATLRERRVEHVSGALDGLDGVLLDFPALEAALGDGRIPPEDLWMWIGRKRIDLDLLRLRTGESIDPAGLAQMRGQGAAYSIGDLQRRFASLAELASGVSHWLGDPVEVVGVASHGSRSGVPVHHDEENVFILQLAGSKHWQMIGDPVTAGLHTNAVTGDPGETRELTMRAGDLMFLPAGQRHVCTGEGDSLHIALLILHGDASALPGLPDAAARDPVLCEPYLAFADEADRAAVIDRYRARLPDHLRGADIAAALTRRRELALSDARFKFFPEGPFSPFQDG